MHTARKPKIVAACTLILAGLALPAFGAPSMSMVASADGPKGIIDLAYFTVDSEANTMTYELAPAFQGQEATARIQGFAPAGWDAKTLVEVPASGRGVWHFQEVDKQNILDGLAYFTVTTGGDKEKTLRGHIELEEKPIPRFPQISGKALTAGTCNVGGLSVKGVVEDARVDMLPAQVKMIRNAPSDPDKDGLADVELNVTVRVGGAYVEGLGFIQIEMLGDENPAHVEALQAGSDFPAVMTMDLRKRYITPAGTFVSETESYRAESIDRFPPFGTELVPTVDSVRLLDEKTGKPVGTLKLGPITPLYHVHDSIYPVEDPYLPKPAKK